MTSAEIEKLKKRIRQLPNSVSGDGTGFAEQVKRVLEEVVKMIESAN